MKDHSLYGLHGKLVAKTGQGTILAEILLEAAAMMQTAKGCRFYIVSTEEAHPEEVWVTEVWDTKEDHDHSLSDPKVSALISKALPLLEDNPQKGQELQVLGGTGL
ncbi:MAG: antibiotic biosynthesis monooxygenase family protein [Bacteroidota bacterium]